MSLALVAMAGAAFEAEISVRWRRRALDAPARRAAGWSVILSAVGFATFLQHQVLG